MIPGDRQDRAEQKGSLILSGVAFGIFGGIALLTGTTFTHQLAGIGLSAVLGLTVWLWTSRKHRRRLRLLAQPFPAHYRTILQNRIGFYISLDEKEKVRFEKMVTLFLAETRITGIQTEIDDEIRILVAASGIIPVFKFTGWEYFNLGEILIVPDSWKPDHSLIGGVTLGHVQGFQNHQLMRLSKVALERGFSTLNDRKNVGIHEFAHVLDDADGVIDGVPSAFIPSNLIEQWKTVTQNEIEKIRQGLSRINSYGGTNEAEFFAVTSEYFFENPQLLLKENPKLYKLLSQIYKQNPAARIDMDINHYLTPYGKTIGRNDPCPCGSKKKYKQCCLK